MMTLIRITSADDSRLNRLIPLYEESFPESERRKIGQLKRMIENHAPMYFNAIECDGELSGMFVYWDMGDFYYLEHLAVLCFFRLYHESHTKKKAPISLYDWSLFV